MRSGYAEWVMALATLTTAAVVAVQSFSISKALDSSFAGNLQNREIAVCENSVISIKRTTDVIRVYLAIAPRANLDMTDDQSVEDAVARYQLTVGDDVGNHITTLSDTRAQLALLQFYSTPEVSLEIDQMEGGVGRVQKLIGLAQSQWRNPGAPAGEWMGDADVNPATAPRAWLSAIFSASDDVFNGILMINNRCAEIVLGERRGLI